MKSNFGLITSFAIFFLLFALISCQKESTPLPAPGPVQPKDTIKPVVFTDTASLISDSSAKISGRIISAGSDSILSAGIEWKKATEPDSAFRKLFATKDSLSFSFVLNNLLQASEYRFRAFASSAAGTAYGQTLSFETDSIPAIICPQTVTDIDGNVYQVQRIGSRCWMKENLRTKRFRNGTTLKADLDNGTWSAIQAGAQSAYGNDTANVRKYGLLYNQYAVLDVGKVCPIGWHVPTDAEWTELENHLGGAGTAGGKLKASGIQPNGLWASPNTGASNSSGFSALPGGRRLQSGDFQELGEKAWFWCSGSQNTVKPRSLSSGSAASLRTSSPNRTDGYSIRCVAD